MSLEEVRARLEGLKSAAGGWIAKCPAHEDRKASLTLASGDDGRALLCCQAGCKTEDVVAAVGLTMADLFPPKDEPPAKSRIASTYDYRDERGALLFQAVRFEPKDFRQRRPDGGGWAWSIAGVRRVLYRLPELLKSTDVVYVPEGEKDVDALRARGLTATCNVGGAGKWRAEDSQHLRGRRVVVLPDNDEPGAKHAEKVRAMLAGVASAVAVVLLPGLPAKGDVSDWLAAGGTVEALQALAPREPATFQAASDRLAGERAERVATGTRALSFGVRYLDDALGGIAARDLIVLGAKTGIGKTALATITALHNCQQGKRVHYFALEAEEREIERRMKFQIIADLYYRNGVRRRPIRYLDWYMGRLESELGQFEDVADMEMRRVTRNLQTFYRLGSFTSDDFCRQFDAVKDDTDLVILDHLHYVDSDDDNENRAYKQTVKAIRDRAIDAGKPVIVVAHVRKSDRRYETLLPGVEDFHGSSDIPKIATKAIMLAPAHDQKNPEPYLWSTYMQVAKCRLDSQVTRYVSLVLWNARLNAYESDYALGRLTDAGKAFSHLTLDETPEWAQSAKPAMEEGMI